MSYRPVLVVISVLLLAGVPLHASPAAEAAGSSLPTWAHYRGPTDVTKFPDELPVFILAGEPSIGINWNTGKAFFQHGFETFRVEFDDSDLTAQWIDVTPPNSEFNVDPMLYTDPIIGRTYAGGLDGVCSVMSFTDDDGATWIPTGNACVATLDHQSIVSGPWPGGLVPMDIVHSRAVYYCAQASVVTCVTSFDGGLTFPLTSQVSCGGSSTPGFHGSLHVAPNGLTYLPFKNCAGKIGMAYTGNAGRTWFSSAIPGTVTPEDGFDPDVASTPSGWIYIGFANGTGGAHVSMTKNNGTTWSKPIDVGAPLGILTTTFHEMVAGDDDRAALAFLGTTNPGNAFAPEFEGEWHLYVSTTYDAGATWTTQKVSDDPVQRGWICAGGFGCDTGRNLLDFMDAQIDKEGRVLVGYVDGCIAACALPDGTAAQSDSAEAIITRQVGGKTLFRAYDHLFNALVSLPGGPYAGAPGDAIALSGDSRGGAAPYTYAWTLDEKPAGSAADATSFADATAAQTTFTPDVVGAYVLRLKVTDGQNVVATATAALTATLGQPLDVAVGGPYAGEPGEAVAVAGAASGGTGPYTYAWSVTSAPTGSAVGPAWFEDASTGVTTFTPDLEGAYTLTLTVTDALAAQAAASATLTVAPPLPPPPAGPMLVDADGDGRAPGTDIRMVEIVDDNAATFTVILHVDDLANETPGTAAIRGTPTGVETIYAASFLFSENATNAVRYQVAAAHRAVSVLAEPPGAEYAFRLEVSGAGSTGGFVTSLGRIPGVWDEPNGRITWVVPKALMVVKRAPIGVNDPGIMTGGDPVGPGDTLTAFGADVRSWVFTPAGGLGPSATVWDTATGAGVHRFPVGVTASTRGPYEGEIGDATIVAARATDGTGPYSFAWTLADKPAGSTATFGDAARQVTTFTPDLPGAYTLSVTATDATSATSTVTTTLVAVDPNALVADAAGPYSGDVATPIAVTASAIGGTAPYAYAWSILAKPAGSAATNADFASTSSAATTFTPDVAGEYTLQIQVTDDLGAVATDTATLAAVDPNVLSVEAGGPYAGTAGSGVAIAAATTAGSAPYTFAWSILSKPANSTASTSSFASASAAVTTFTPDVPGAYTLQIHVTDDLGATATDTATLTASPATVVFASGTILAGGPHTRVFAIADAGVNNVDGFSFAPPPVGTRITTRTTDQSGLGYDLNIYFFMKDDSVLSCATAARDEVCEVPADVDFVEVAAAAGARLRVDVIEA